MKINNFSVLDSFLQFEEGYFYKFELLVRNTDGDNVLYTDGYSQTNKNIHIKSWYVDSSKYYERIKHEMITMSELTGARLYVTLDRKENVKLAKSLICAFTDVLCAIVTGQKPSIKKLSKVFASETSKVENSSKSTRTLMWDVDTKDTRVLEGIKEYITSKGQTPYVLETKKGYHVFCYRKFNNSYWYPSIQKILGYDVGHVLSMKENELGLVYHPMKNEVEKDG